MLDFIPFATQDLGFALAATATLVAVRAGLDLAVRPRVWARRKRA